MIDGTEPINPHPSGATFDGLTLKQHMVIEFTKAIYTNPEMTTHQHEQRSETVKEAILLANEVIKQLNDEDK